MKKLGCAQCGGAKKMAKGGNTSKKKMQKGGIAEIVGMPKYDNNPRSYSGASLKKGGVAKAKFGASVAVQRSPRTGKVTGVDGGYAKVGQREPERTKFQKGGVSISVRTPQANDPYPKEKRRLESELTKIKKAYTEKMKAAKAKLVKAQDTLSGKRGKKYQKGGFPDLTGDGKVTKADILKGRGVIKRRGGSVKKK